MKKLLLTTLLTAGAVSAFAQGKVTFNNITSTYVANGAPGDRLIRYSGSGGALNPFGTNNAPVVNFGTTSYRVQLYYGASTDPESALIPVATAPAVFRASTTTIPGTWNPGDRTLVGFDTGATANLEVKFWDNALASSYEAAVALGANYTGMIGHSLMFSYTVPTDPLASPGAFLMTGLQGFTVSSVPEPGTCALLGLGAAGMLIFRRRK